MDGQGGADDFAARLPAALTTASLTAALRQESPINLARAFDVMAQHGLDGIIVGNPVNVFHMTGYWPQIAHTKAGQPPTTFALLSRDPHRSRAVIASTFIYYYTFSDAGFAAEIEPYLYLEAGDAGAEETEEPGKAASGWVDRRLAPLSPIEQRRREGLENARARHFIRTDAGGALVAAMRDFGLWTGTIGFDDPVIAAVSTYHDRPGRLVPADNILREIRLVKSPLEIALMQRASWMNVEAVEATARQIRTGMSYGELRQIFYQEAVRRENLPVFMTVDRVSSPLADAKVCDGQAFFVDGVSHYQNYHGDYARTVFVGEPIAPMRQAAAAMALGWDAVRERLRPGLRYTKIAAIGNDALRKAGFNFTIGFGPHSVGLSHTDEPGRDAGGFYAKQDIVLQENMVLSVDCPIVDTGLGGSAHLEDLMLITKDGAVPLHPVADPVIIV